MAENRVKIELADQVATVTLARPHKHNALDVAMFDALADAAEQMGREPGVRAVLLHGEGPSFCSGLDVKSMIAAEGGMEEMLERLRGEVPNWFQRAAYGWVRVPVPVIAAVHGNCLGGGLQIALAADMRIAAPDARLSVLEIKWGLIPDMGITQTLPRLVGLDVAKDLLYTGKILSGADAHALGIVTHLAEDPLDTARELAAQIASRSPDAVRAAKQLLEQAWNRSAQETLALEAEAQLGLIGSPNQLAAAAAGVSGQPARFSDPA